MIILNILFTLLTFSQKFNLLSKPEQLPILKRLKQKELKWWQKGVIYHIYHKSFKDTTGNGMGDLKGIIEKLDYLKDGTENSLNIDIILLSPFTKSPQYDSGYDVSGYKEVDPLFGTIEDFEELTKQAHKRGIKVVVEYVGNHSSDEHPWFIESKSSRDNPKADWYYWRDPKPDGSPPNNWINVFGGSSWTFSKPRNQYYLHDFTSRQPNLNWRNPEVEAEMFDVLRYWISKGADGFRLDAVAMFMKNKKMPDEKIRGKGILRQNFDHQDHAYDTDDPDIHPLLQRMHKVVEEVPREILLLGELNVQGTRNRYVGSPNNREIDISTFFNLMEINWSQESILAAIKEQEDAVGLYGWPDYVLTNHDRPRIASRIGLRRARAAALMLLTLRGTPMIYYGDELGMKNTYINSDKLLDPQIKKDKAKFCRDFVRTPMQWNGEKNAGFSKAEEKKLWLPIAHNFRDVNVENEEKIPISMLNFYKKLLRIRKKNSALYGGDIKLHRFDELNVLGYKRYTLRSSFTVLVNFEKREVTLYLDLDDLIVISSFMDRKEKLKKRKLKLRPGEAVLIKNRVNFF